MSYFVKRDDSGAIVSFAASMQYEPAVDGSQRKALDGWTGEQIQDDDPALIAAMNPPAQPTIQDIIDVLPQASKDALAEKQASRSLASAISGRGAV